MEERVILAAKRQPDRYVLYRDGEGQLIAFEDADSGYYWFKLSSGVWAWVV